MKRTLAVVIDASQVTCGKCPVNERGWCHLFTKHLESNARHAWIRCAPCLAAEREARK